MLCSAWFLGVYIEGGSSYLENLTINQTVNRGVNSFTHQAPFYYYILRSSFTFLPWSIFIGMGLFKWITSGVEKSKIEKLFACTSLITLIIISMVSSKLDIYMLPIYPFIVFLGMMGWQKSLNKSYWKGALFLPWIVLLLLFPLLIIVKEFPETLELGFNIPLSFTIAGFIAFISSIVGAYFLWIRSSFSKASSVIVLGFMFFVGIACLDLSTINPKIGAKQLVSATENELQKDSSLKLYSVHFDDTGNLYYYLDQRVINKESMQELMKVKDFVENRCLLYVRNKDIRRNPEISKYIESTKKVFEGEQYSLYLKEAISK